MGLSYERAGSVIVIYTGMLTQSVDFLQEEERVLHITLASVRASVGVAHFD